MEVSVLGQGIFDSGDQDSIKRAFLFRGLLKVCKSDPDQAGSDLQELLCISMIFWPDLNG